MLFKSDRSKNSAAFLPRIRSNRLSLFLPPAALLPTAVIAKDDSDIARAMIGALRATDYFDIKYVAHGEADADKLILSNKAQFVIQIPPDFTRRLVRGDRFVADTELAVGDAERRHDQHLLLRIPCVEIEALRLEERAHGGGVVRHIVLNPCPCAERLDPQPGIVLTRSVLDREFGDLERRGRASDGAELAGQFGQGWDLVG